MITRAQLNAALSNLENKIERNMEMQLDAKVAELKDDIRGEAKKSESGREIVEEEIYEETDMEIGKIKEDCRRNREALQKMKSQLIELEKSFDRFRSQHGAEDLAGEDARGEY